RMSRTFAPPAMGQILEPDDLMRGILLLSATLLTLTGCKEDIAGPSSIACHPALITFQTLAADTVTTGEGVRYIEIAVGSGGEAVIGETVDVNYSLYSTNGSFIESSCTDGVPVIRFLVGGQGIIPGFQIGVIGMREGGVRRVIVPAQLAYGDRDLIFDIELVDLL
ncbi:MAG TPA: FKBP-type peptidyl-prolyl cis-trans isomerase, partial [Longimicrobiaceae bacterium]|nr:FKBP-type peptidyl-prolyl cis-trans isomerase [Longimicrobiaceae bacterium]